MAWSLASAARAAETVWLDTLDLSTMHQGWGAPQINRSIRETPLSIGGQKFARGVGTHANSTYRLTINGGTERFTAHVGVDDAAGGPGSVVFQVVADGKRVFRSGVMKPGQAAKPVDVDLRGVKTLLLLVTDAGDGINFDHGNWADARFLVSGPKPVPYKPPHEAPYLLTPKPGPAPRLNGPKVYGARPGHPFLYRIPAQGERPMTFSARSLPKTLRLDAQTGIITGTTPPRGEYRITLHARNRHGRDQRPFKLVSGDTLALTPPMGWNHWYAHYDRITDAMMREAADILIRSGMADVGYQYVNIDDCWMNADQHKDPLRNGPFRDAAGNLLPNKHFHDMKALADYIHSQGLKAGLYTSPGPKTCAGFAGAYQHEAQDARQFAEWGYDFLKYDWCSYGEIAKTNPAPALVKYKQPYQLMGDLLKQQPRDLVFNLCQYGMGEVWKWGAEVGGHSWRTAGDLGFELDRIFEVALKNCEHRDWQKPGAWNDPDYIQIGWIGNARGGGLPEPCPLTPTEQYSFMSLWALMAAPLFYSGDLSKLDEFTLNVLCNPEVIEVNQDPLGQCARVVRLSEDTFLMVKDLEDGTKAVSLCNQGEEPSTITAKWSDIGIKGRQPVRDLWRHKDLGKFTGEFRVEVPRRGVVLVRIGRPLSRLRWAARRGERPRKPQRKKLMQWPARGHARPTVGHCGIPAFRAFRISENRRPAYASDMSASAHRRTKIVATLGPATDAPERIGQLVDAGVNVFRLNLTHAAPDWVRRVVRDIRTAAAQRRTFVGVMMDLQGPSIRTGDLPAPLELQPGQPFTFTVRGERDAGPRSVSVNYDQFIEDIGVGDMVLIDAGVIQMRVLAKRGHRVECEVVAGGTLGNRRHINLPGVTVRLPALTEKDRADARLGLEVGVDFLSLSFVREAQHLRELRSMLNSAAQPPLVIAKIEDQQAVRNLEGIIREADAVMVARGDLGIEVPYEELPILQRQMVEHCLRLGRPVIVATQILESMIQSPVPTRAEVTDAANAVFEQADAVMLSGETSVGQHPLKCVNVLDRIARRIEGSRTDGYQTRAELTLPRQKLVKSAVVMADELCAEAILVFTRTGSMARHVAWLRPRCSRILALCETERTAAALALSWGVRPLIVPFDHTDPERSIEGALKLLVARGVLQSGQTTVIVSSMTSGDQVVDAVQMRTL